MATHASAVKRHRQSQTREEHNRWWRSRVRTATKKVLEAVSKKDKKEAQASLKAATVEIMKAKREGVLHSNNASRKVSRLASRVAQI